MPRLTALLAALALVLGVSALPAYADDDPTGPPTPTGTPQSRPGDPFGGQTLPPGDVFIVTPGSTSTSLPHPADPDDVQQQIDKDIAKARTESPSATPGSTATSTPTAGATAIDTGTPVDGLGTSSAGTTTDSGSSTSSPMLWWVLGALVAALAIGGVIVVRLRRRRGDPEAPGVP